MVNSLKLPKGERAWSSYYSSDKNLKFLITSKKDSREMYFLYEYTDGGLKKLGKSKSPGELEIKYDVKKKMRREK